MSNETEKNRALGLHADRRQGAKDAKGGFEEPPNDLDRIAHTTIGAAIEVHKNLGPGFLESIYEEALVLELEVRGLRSQRQVEIPINYKDRVLKSARLDLVVEESLVVEIKAIEALRPIHTAQAISYLRAGGYRLALLLNFNVYLMRDGVKRIVWTDPKKILGVLGALAANSGSRTS